MRFEYDGSAKSILDWLDEGGYSCVLYFNGKQHAYVVDEDDDYGWQRVPVISVRELLSTEQIAVWRKHDNYDAYRPKAWVEEWERQHPPQKTQQQQPVRVGCLRCGWRGTRRVDVYAQCPNCGMAPRLMSELQALMSK